MSSRLGKEVQINKGKGKAEKSRGRDDGEMILGGSSDGSSDLVVPPCRPWVYGWTH